MNIPSQYNSKDTESKWYNYWLEHDHFSSKPDEREPYTIVMPPPNVTGVLHMGHMLNNTIQDVLIRRARLNGKNACWVPGTDHASIATEAKVVAQLKEQGINKNDLSRSEFLDHAWQWTHQYGGVILEQLKKLGCSCDWNRTKFTMDDDMSQSVIKVFIDLYKKGLIYRGYRMVNWDPEAKTTLSDEEVNHIEQNDKLYYIKYKIKDEDTYLTIATTRPETILGDTAVCVNPKDERYTHLKGKQIMVPICNRKVPIIVDDYVDIEFGTGCLKVTPAHDINDKDIGERHNLDIIDILNEDGSLNQHGLHHQGKDRFIARQEIVKELKLLGLLVKTEDIVHKVGISERTKAIIEPRLSDQWFLKMEDLVKPAVKAVLDTKDIKLFPKKFKNTYRHWVEHIRDWNISRQLIWGQQIPAYYYGKGKNDFIVAECLEDAFEIAKKQKGIDITDKKQLKQETDVLDTWFSSWLWPISVFDGIRNPNNNDISYYYPTNDLITAPDILFFWVVRMIIAGYQFKEKKPFTNIYLTGLVRDNQGKKMSKSLGNSPDALKLIDRYGADGVRVGLLLSASNGNDLMFDENLCQQGKEFANKIWNAFRLIKGWEVKDIPQPQYAKVAIQWFESKFQNTLTIIEDHYSKYRISDALMQTYKLLWTDFCSWFLEMIKPEYKQPIDKITYNKTISILENNLTLLHPFMPFLTEDIWQRITSRDPSKALINSKWPSTYINNEIQIRIEEFDFASQVISGIRKIRDQKNIPKKDKLKCVVINNEYINKTFDELIVKLANLEALIYSNVTIDNALTFRVKSNEYFIPINTTISIEDEIKKLSTELEYMQGFLKTIVKKLSNSSFIDNAPQQIVKKEEKKKEDALAKIKILKTSLEKLNKS